MDIIRSIFSMVNLSGFSGLTLENLIMILVGLTLLYLAIGKKYEPLLLVPIAFGAILVNLPFSGLMEEGGFLNILSFGIRHELFPILIFMGIGAMTDFGPLLANPVTFLLGAAAQLGVFVALIIAVLLGFNLKEAAAIGIIGGADGPTAIYLASKTAPHLIGAIAVAAYSYMSLVPIIQPPVMKLLTTPEQRKIVMKQLRPVSKLEKILFPIISTILVGLILPTSVPIIGILMLGNLFRECLVVDRLSNTAQNELINIVTIFLSLCVGATMQAEYFLTVETIKIITLGLVAFACSTAGGVLFGQILYKFSGGKINPLIGSAGVSAVPMAARVVQKVGQQANPRNFLLMHAMGPNVAGVIGTAVAAGVFLALLQ
ncbi:MAG: sodium ion-translocating decarboxylase subunit beta [Candidatus Atribacteria bacterium]|nr:sodium ion-translocating decarboxylase subunit beta [Candidatus Atribacteria bacterium]